MKAVSYGRSSESRGNSQCYHQFTACMHVELLGIPRERAGVAHVQLEAHSLGQLLDALALRFPRLGELIVGGRLHPSVVANLNGDEFVSDRHQKLTDGDHVLILSADVGG